MRIFSFLKSGEPRVGVQRDSKFLDLYEAYKILYGTREAPGFLTDMKKIIAMGKPVINVIRELESSWPKEAELTSEPDWLPPVPAPEKILCPAVNYRAHGRRLEHLHHLNRTSLPSSPVHWLDMINP